MSYQVYARKYRPQFFREILGQDAIVKTLENAITYKRLHQAYLFCGARGVGKTSLARIFSKALNCEEGPTVNPCQKCSTCQSITAGNSLDVLEIDGASNTGVDNVRELREQAKYLPTAGKYKIYIVDEVHMLSQSAFNALLKTLEEPPPHIVFIFATTEPHKIPVTILSRCQRFDLKRLSHPLLLGHLKNILTQEELKLEDESLSLIAHCSEGSVRDSLSLLDQIISFCGSNPKPDQVREILGLADRVLLFEVLESLLREDVLACLNKAKDIYEKGIDLKIFSEELLQLIRHLLILSEGGEEVLDLPPGEVDQLKRIVSLAKSGHYLMLFQILSRGAGEIARSDFPRLIFEITLIKMVKARELISISEIIDNLEKQSAERVQGTGFRVEDHCRPSTVDRRPLSDMEVQKPSTINPATTALAPKGPPAEAGRHLLSTDQSNTWGSFVKKVLEARPQLGAILEHARPLKVEDGVLSLGFEPKSLYADMLKDRISTLQELATSFFKKSVKFDIRSIQETSNHPPTEREIREENERKRAEKTKSEALSDPMVKKAQEILGAKVKEVKEIK